MPSVMGLLEEREAAARVRAEVEREGGCGARAVARGGWGEGGVWGGGGGGGGGGGRGGVGGAGRPRAGGRTGRPGGARPGPGARMGAGDVRRTQRRAQAS